jgi:hypothetical protein
VDNPATPLTRLYFSWSPMPRVRLRIDEKILKSAAQESRRRRHRDRLRNGKGFP